MNNGSLHKDGVPERLHPKKLEHFLKVVQFGSFSRAAEKLNTAQPVLSREIHALEADLGVLLLTRHARGVTLTPAGEALKKEAESILAQLDGVRDAVNDAAGQPTGRVAFGMPASMTGVLAGALIRDFLKMYPKVKLQIREGTSMQLRTSLLTREIDFAVLTAPVSEPQLLTRPLFSEPFVLVGPTHSKFSGIREIELRNVAKYPLILPVMPNSTRILIETAFEHEGITPQISLETDAAPIAQFISHGLGYAILPACAVSSQTLVSSSIGISYVPIKGLSLTRMLASPCGVSMSLGTRKLSQMLTEHIKVLIDSGRLVGNYLCS